MALNIIGDELIPLDAEKHTETPLIESIDPVCVFLGNRPVAYSDPCRKMSPGHRRYKILKATPQPGL